MKTCATCTDESCPTQGVDTPACEDWTNTDLPTETPPQPDPLAALQAQFEQLQREHEAVKRAVAAFTRAFTEA